MNPKKILVVRKMSALEYYYHGNHKSESLNERHDSNNHGVEQIKDMLLEAQVLFDIVTRKNLSEVLIKEYDAVISAGGDGTVIAVGAYNPDVPQLNLRTDRRSVGALCQKNIKNSLSAFLSGRYKIEEWQREDVYFDKQFVGRASNEVCIGERLRFDKLAKYMLSFAEPRTGKVRQEIQRSSGLVVVTGTGSTAWPAAFKPYGRGKAYFKFKSLLPYQGVIRQGVASSLEIVYKEHEGKFSIDTKEYDFPRDSLLEIKLSKNPLKVIVPE